MLVLADVQAKHQTRGLDLALCRELEHPVEHVKDSSMPTRVVELDGDSASGRCSVEIRLVQDGEAYTAAGWYDDSYRRDGGGWRFAHRKFHVFHWVPLAKGWA